MIAAARIGFIGRLMLILTAALLAMTGLTVGIDYLAHRNDLAHPSARFPRIVHAAGLVALVRGADAKRQSRVVHYATNDLVRVEIVDTRPQPTPDDIRAPELEKRLHATVGAADGDLLQAYTNREMFAAPGVTVVEGRLTKVFAGLGDGRTLVVEWLDPPRITLFKLLGLPPGVWTGLLGLAIATLAVHAIAREMRPLRRLTEAVSRFDGGQPPAAFDESGAPDVRRLARAVRDMQSRVATLLGERSFLVGAISHDLRIYLTRLRLRAEAVADDEARARLIADLDGMASLVDTSLAFTRATTSAEKTRRVDLGDLVAVEVEEHAALGPKARLEGTYADDAIVAGDPVALRRVVANVLDNALKFARNVVRVRVERAPTRERIVIEDDGPGIPEADRRRVFDPFFRAEARGRGGTGLGLAIARQIVEAHGGTIEVVDAAIVEAETRGAAVLISLPPWRG